MTNKFSKLKEILDKRGFPYDRGTLPVIVVERIERWRENMIKQLKKRMDIHQFNAPGICCRKLMEELLEALE